MKATINRIRMVVIVGLLGGFALWLIYLLKFGENNWGLVKKGLALAIAFSAYGAYLVTKSKIDEFKMGEAAKEIVDGNFA